jgi:hypothetical protein
MILADKVFRADLFGPVETTEGLTRAYLRRLASKFAHQLLGGPAHWLYIRAGGIVGNISSSTG